MEKLTKYDLVSSSDICDCHMSILPNGTYIKFSDVEKILEKSETNECEKEIAMLFFHGDFNLKKFIQYIGKDNIEKALNN